MNCRLCFNYDSDVYDMFEIDDSSLLDSLSEFWLKDALGGHMQGCSSLQIINMALYSLNATGYREYKSLGCQVVGEAPSTLSLL